jgi:glucan phosphoethanolaminetransferase (alkaline phosphatase superfamily)
MEFFIPSLLIFLLSVAVSFILVPRLTPLIIAILSIVLLAYGVYTHYNMFASEYRLSTWPERAKLYAPAIMIGSIIVFIIYTILALFTKGAVPVPPLPNITVPSPNTATNVVVDSLNKIANSISNKSNDILTSINRSINRANSNRSNILGAITGNNNAAATENRNKNKNGNNLSRSFLETI